MPRCSAISVDQIFEILQKKIVFNKNGKVLKKSDKVWKEASSAINHLVCGSTLYFYVLKDWKGLGSKLKEYYLQNQNVECIANVKKEEKAIDNCSKIEFTITFDKIEWQKIEPILRKGKKVLPEGWSHVIVQKICSCEQIPCPYSFEKGYVTRKDDSIKLIGYCKECGNSMRGICRYMTSAENYTFQISTKDSRSIRHFSKRPLSGPLRDECQKILIHEKALKFKRHEAEKNIAYGNVEGPLVHTTPVLRKARQDGIFKAYGVKSTKNVVDAIISMKFDEKWSSIIRQIGDFPFNVVFWSPEQMDLWNTINSEEDITVSLDAAGRFVKKIRIGSEVSSHIFLYIISASIGGKIYPVFQFLSEYHAAIFLKDCLSLWLESGASKPQQLVTDRSSALQNAVCLAFNNCSYKDYLLACHNKVLGLRDDLPPCFYRLDIAHLIKSITKWKCFDKYSPNIKDFYLRIISYLSTLTSYQDFMKVVKLVFIVCLSPGIGGDSCEVARSTSYLFSVIKTHECNYCEESCTCDFCNEKKLNDDELSEEDDLNSIETEIENLRLSAMKYISETNKNDFYCSDLVKNFKDLCSEYPTWTNILTESYSSKITIASSGRSESLFSDMRNITNIHRPISGHLFIAQYCVFLDGSMKLGKAYLQNEKLMSPTVRKSLSLNTSKLAGCTDLDNSITQNNVTKKRGKYLEPCSDIQIQYSQSKIKSSKDVIVNGILRRPIQHNKIVYAYTSSCLFDSIMELCISAYGSYATYETIVNDTCQNKSCFGAVMIEYLLTGKQKVFYKKRFDLCLKHFDVKHGILYYKKSIGHLIQQFFNECTTDVFYVLLQPKIISEILNINKLDCYIKEHTLDTHLSKYIFIDMQNFESQTFNILNIPVKLTIHKKNFMLVGVIAYSASKFSTLVHYTAYCRSVKNNWYLKDDLAKTTQYLKKKSIHTVKIAIVMYVEI